MAERIVNAMSVDVEDYFQVSAFANHVRRDEWPNLPSRVERNTEKVMGIFAAAGVKSTFFTLGWVAERHKPLIRRIVAEGHELASHGFAHFRASDQTREEFRADVRRTKAILEDVGGVAVQGYRAASFSIGAANLWALEVLAEEGYRYSSSIYPVRHDHYGMPEAPRFKHRPVGEAGVVEIPISTLRLAGRNLPVGGGGYFRLAPYAAYRWALSKLNRDDRQPAIFYFHPWEVDPEQPRPEGLPAKTRFRHYVNLGRMEHRLATMLNDFAWDRVDRVFLAGDSAAPRPT
jgi:polysaccharide deacetylase family protein (PEP-CTERM system associated)